MPGNIGTVLRSWRRASGIKQQGLADRLGVTQATISRWENGLDEPSAKILAKIRELIGSRKISDDDIDLRILSLQPGLRALVELEGWTLVGATQSFKRAWPELGGFIGHRFAEYLIGQTAEIYNDTALVSSIKRGEVRLVSGVTDRHLKGFGDNAFRHHWAAAYRHVGSRCFAEISFEACDPNAELGLREILRLDEIE